MLHVQDFDDIDQQAKSLRGFDQRYQQLSPGPYRGRFATRHLGGGVRLHVEEVGRSVQQRAHVPAGVRAFGLMLRAAGRSSIGGESIGAWSLVDFVAGQTVEGHLSAGARFCVIEFDCTVPGGERMADLGGPTIRQVRELGEAAFQALRHAVHLAMQPASTPQLDAALRDQLVSGLETLPGASPLSGTALTAKRRHRIFCRLHEYFDQHLAEPISLVEAGRVVGASRRQLENCVSEHAGCSPAAYLRRLRLNALRRSLQSGAYTPPSVGDAAARVGLWHLGRAAAQYRALFGELPSQTAAR